MRDAERISELRRFTQDNIAFDSHRATLLKKHPNEWIAFYDGAVRVTGRSLAEVLERADQAGLPRRSLCVHYMDSNPVAMIL